MNRFPRSVSSVLAGLVLIGLPACGAGKVDTSYAGKEPPHKGELVVLADPNGFVEVVTKPGPEPEYSFYFLKPDYEEFTPAPSSGTLTVGGKTVTLKPGTGGGLVIPPGPSPFGKGGLDGNLSVELAGKTVRVPLGGR